MISEKNGKKNNLKEIFLTIYWIAWDNNSNNNNNNNYIYIYICRPKIISLRLMWEDIENWETALQINNDNYKLFFSC